MFLFTQFIVSLILSNAAREYVFRKSKSRSSIERTQNGTPGKLDKFDQFLILKNSTSAALPCRKGQSTVVRVCRKRRFEHENLPSRIKFGLFRTVCQVLQHMCCSQFFLLLLISQKLNYKQAFSFLLMKFNCVLLYMDNIREKDIMGTNKASKRSSGKWFIYSPRK